MRAVAYLFPTFWTRGSGRRLRGDRNAQVLALYLMSAPGSNIIGLYYLPITTIAHETGLTLDEVRETFKRLGEIAKYDESAELVWLPAGAEHQIGETMAPKDKRRGAVLRELDMVGRHPFVEEFVRLYGNRYHLDGALAVGIAGNTDAPSKGDAAAVQDLTPSASPPSSDLSDPDLDLPDRSRQRPAAHAGLPDPVAKVPCPPDLRLLDSQIATLETSLVPRWAVEVLMAGFVGKYQGATSDRRTVDDWRKGMWTAVNGNWNDPSKRPKKPPDDPELGDQERRQRALDVEARARAARDAKARQTGTGGRQ